MFIITHFRRADATPTKNNRLCSCHFKDGQRINGPSLFKWNESQLFTYTSPEKRQRFIFAIGLTIIVLF